MVTEKSLLSVQMLLISAYLSCWYAGLLSYFNDNGLINYISISIFGAIVLITASIVILAERNQNKWLRTVIVLLNIVPLVLLVFQILQDVLVFPVLLLSALAQGLLIGSILQHSMFFLHLKQNLTFLLLGCLASMIPLYLPVESIGNNKMNPSPGFTFGGNTGLATIMIILLMMTAALAFLIKSTIKSEHKKIPEISDFTGLVKFSVMALAALYLLTEIIFYFWSVILIHDNQSFMSSLTFPLTIISVFTFRSISSKIENRIANIGWLFTLSIILCASLGMFYTFSFTPVFILGFGLSTAFLISIHQRLFHFRIDKKNIAYLLMLASVAMVIVGLYIQNHIEFIRSINMPEAVIALSARQAIIKELASFAGITVILSGYLFLRRRTIFSS